MVIQRLLEEFDEIRRRSEFARDVKDTDQDFWSEQFKDLMSHERAELFERWMVERWEDLEGEILDHAGEQGAGLLVYRCIGINDPGKFVERTLGGKFMRGVKGLGVHWSYDLDRAECHWKSGRYEVYVEGLVAYQAIEVYETLLRNFNASLGLDEAEIYVERGAPVEVVGIGVPAPRSFRWLRPKKQLVMRA